MKLDKKALASVTRRFQPSAYIRCTPIAHKKTPLGMGYGETRFASLNDSFKLLYIAKDLPTSIAEAIVRDRFEGAGPRQLMDSDIEDWGACAVTATMPLNVVDLRRDGCFKLGISTDIVGAKSHDEARLFSQTIHDTTDLDGILYHSRLLKKDCVAIYERAVGHLDATSVLPLERLEDLIPALRRLKITLLK